MKAMTYQKESDSFTLADIPIPEIETSLDVLVKVNAVGLNPVDAKVHLWNSMVPEMDNNFVGGLDISGEIVSLGSDVKGWRKGDRVLCHGNMRRIRGGFAEFSVQDSRTLLPHPEVRDTVAAAVPCAGWTAYRALVDKLRISPDSSLFIAGGSGGVGSFAIQIARYLGAETIITSCSEANHDYVTRLGATHVIDYRKEDVVERVTEITHGQGVRFSLDCVGGNSELECASVLGFEGEMVALVTTVNPTLYPDAFLKGLSFHQLSLGSGHVNGEQGFQSIVQAGTAVSRMLEEGTISVPDIKVISLEEVGLSLIEMRNQRTVGKVVAKLS